MTTWLRMLRPDDASAVLSAFSSDPLMARQGTVRNLEEAQQYVGRLLESAETVKPWAVVDHDDRLVGLIGITIDVANRVGWFWYWMDASQRGRGHASRAATVVANWALMDGGLERLELGHRANNPASARVALAAGFVHEGTERQKFLVDDERIDVLTYGRLRTDPWPETPAEPAIVPLA